MRAVSVWLNQAAQDASNGRWPIPWRYPQSGGQCTDTEPVQPLQAHSPSDRRSGHVNRSDLARSAHAPHVHVGHSPSHGRMFHVAADPQPCGPVRWSHDNGLQIQSEATVWELHQSYLANQAMHATSSPAHPPIRWPLTLNDDHCTRSKARSKLRPYHPSRTVKLCRSPQVASGWYGLNPGPIASPKERNKPMHDMGLRN